MRKRAKRAAGRRRGAPAPDAGRLLGRTSVAVAEEQSLPEIEWLANIANPNTREAYRLDLRAFGEWLGVRSLPALRTVTKAQVIAWREHLLESGHAKATVRRRLAALSSFYEGLAEGGVIAANPATGVEPPRERSREGKTAVLSAEQARKLLECPDPGTLKGVRDRAILATLLYHGLRRAEVCALRVRDVHQRDGVPHFRVRGKGGKVRYVPVAPPALQWISRYLELAGMGLDGETPLFRAVRQRESAGNTRGLSGTALYTRVVKHYAVQAGLDAVVDGICVHSLRATAATNALQRDADISSVQDWLGHADVSTTQTYDRRKAAVADSPSYRVRY